MLTNIEQNKNQTAGSISRFLNIFNLKKGLSKDGVTMINQIGTTQLNKYIDFGFLLFINIISRIIPTVIKT
jgi:hypothetical protein